MFELLWALYVYFLNPLLTILFFILLAFVIMSWLFTFGIISYSNTTARQIFDMLSSIVEPLARPIRRVVPPLGQLDLSIILLFLIVIFVRDFALPQTIFLFR